MFLAALSGHYTDVAGGQPRLSTGIRTTSDFLQAPADLSEDSLTGTDLSTPTERKQVKPLNSFYNAMAPFQLELGYETVQKDDKEVQALADVTLRTTIESTSASEEPDYRAIDVLLNPDLLKQVERDNAAKAVPFNKEDDMRDYGRELMEKSRALRLQKTNCEATDPMSYWIAHPHGDSGRSVSHFDELFCLTAARSDR